MKTIFLKATLCCLLLNLLSVKSKAQLNLIPDPSFEDITNTVNGSGQMSLKEWHNLDSTKPNATRFGYFSYITQNPPFSLPDNQWFYQNSRSGGGVAEFDFLWVNNPSMKRSLARTKLKHPLIAGKTYCAKMYVNPCDKNGDFFTDGIAMYFDNGKLDTIIAFDSSGVYPFVNPQVSNPTGNMLNDTMNWIAVSGNFVANGIETFLTIGNFKTDAATTKVFNPATYIPPDTVNGSSLLIDDISLIPIDAANWLHDTSCILGDSVYIGLAKYEMPDGMWYDINMNFLKKGSGIKVKPTQWATQYIQAIDVCSSIRYDTMTVWAAPLGVEDMNAIKGIEIYPNPVSSTLYIKTSSPNLRELYNAIGQLVFSTSTREIDVSKLSKGMYYLKIGDAVKKVIIE